MHSLKLFNKYKNTPNNCLANKESIIENFTSYTELNLREMTNTCIKKVFSV